eukprot:5977587-Amphidinium_carterae.1
MTPDDSNDRVSQRVDRMAKEYDTSGLNTAWGDQDADCAPLDLQQHVVQMVLLVTFASHVSQGGTWRLKLCLA